jgi:hypothetical protein
MAYDRYDTRDEPRGERSRWFDDRNDQRDWRGSDQQRGERNWWDDDRSSSGRDRGGRDDRGFFERAGDEIASWFGDDDAERRRRQDQMRDQREGRSGGYDRGRHIHSERDDWDQRHSTAIRGGYSDRDYNPSYRRELGGRDSNWDRSNDRDFDRGGSYRPMTGDYGRSERFLGAGAAGAAAMSDRDTRDYNRSQTPWGRDDYRSTSRAGTSDRSDRSRHEDPHYDSWRSRHMADLDRDYDDYRREHQSKFESDFGSWRERRQQKRGLLGQIREHMEVVGSDGEHVGTVDKTAGDRLILTRSDPESGGIHHSISCSDIDRIEKDKVILDCSADQAKNRWRDESRGRALFEREDQGEIGPRALDKSFEGTYR